MSGTHLKSRVLIFLVAAFLVSLVANIIWTSIVAQQQMQRELQERGQVVALQMRETWEQLVEIQLQLQDIQESQVSDYERAYAEVYTNLNCAVIGRNIGILFSDSSGYVTRYVNNNPRNIDNEPDAFEAHALELFRASSPQTAYYEVTEYDSREAFRYVEPMLISESCLQCHGEPAGELDITGHEKEGKAVGDIAGAVSVVVPMDAYVAMGQANVVRNLAIFVVLMAAVLSAIYIYITRSNRLLEEQHQQLEEANERLRAENQYKSDFLSMVSHELRTPLTSILAFSEMLNKDDASSEAGQMGQAVGAVDEATARREIETNSRVLLLMINDILEMNRLDAGRAQLALEAVDIVDLFGFVEPVVSPIARQAQIDFSSSVDADIPVITADFDKLAHGLENLAFNAVKFTSEGGSIRMRASLSEDGQSVLLSVEDTGIGIAPEDQQRIFERFVQADSSIARKYNGTGLGLPLAKEYAELHGGELLLESTPGVGSTFTMRIPIQPAEALSATRETAEGAGVTRQEGEGAERG